MMDFLNKAFECLATMGELDGMESNMQDGLSSPNFYKAVAHCDQNKRKRREMEDSHRIAPVLEDLREFSYFGVYDGHGGRAVVDFVENNLEKNIAAELRQSRIGAHNNNDIPERLVRAYLTTDAQTRQLGITMSGATAVSVLIKGNKDHTDRVLYVANVGDSRAVLVTSRRDKKHKGDPPSSGFHGRRLTHDHRADDEEEKERIVKAGGFVARSRVLGILAVTRSFGDNNMKDYVIAEPYVSVTRLNENGECPLLIVACDGVWDVISDQEAADMLMARLAEHDGPDDDAAKYLVNAAIRKGSTDNVTAVVVYL